MASANAMQTDSPVRQNWVLGPALDSLLIIGAPVLGVLFTVFLFQQAGMRGVLLVISIYNIAHHFPTFIRIYGDKRLLQRFKWSLLLGPVVPFSLAMGTVLYVIQSGNNISIIYHLLIVLVIWAPWHLLMQHFGFVRIYDRHNQAPRRIAARMDLWVCWAWFAYLLVAALDWLPNILYQAYFHQGLNIIFVLNENVFPILQGTLLFVAIAMTIAYLAYIAWCYRKGFFVSWAKILLSAVTLVCLYAAFLPGGIVSRYVVGWSFALGFAALSFVHNTQYFAIVWKYNRSLARRQENVRSDSFRRAFTAYWPAVLIAYVLVSIAYGTLLAQTFYDATSLLANSTWLVGIVFALAFTSEIMHYYYDGFIWKVRHRENRQHLDMAASERDVSWSEQNSGERPFPVLGRQFLYLGLPMLVVMFGFWANRQPGMVQDPTFVASRAKLPSEMTEANAAITAGINLEKQMLRIRPRAMHYVKLGDLYHWRAYLEQRIAEAEGRVVKEQILVDLRRQAKESYELALKLPPPLLPLGESDGERKKIVSRSIGRLPPGVPRQ